jgi:hypothetical protein
MLARAPARTHIETSPLKAGLIKVTDVTVALTQEHDRRFVRLRHRLRTAGYRLSADCERLLDDPQVTTRPALREALGKALVESRRLIALTTLHDGRPERLHGDETQLTAAAQEIRDAVSTALNDVLGLVAVSSDEELVLRDVCRSSACWSRREPGERDESQGSRCHIGCPGTAHFPRARRGR